MSTQPGSPHGAGAPALAILYDLALTISGQMSLTPMLTHFLQRLLYHTGYPVGLFFERIGPPEGEPEHCLADLRLAIGDFALGRRQGTTLSLPADLLCGGPALLDQPARWAALELRTPRRQAIRLPVGDQGVILLFGNPAGPAPLPYTELFAPVLENLARAVVFCRNYEQAYQHVVDSYSDSLNRQKLYAQVLANTRDGVLITDPALQVLDCTDAFTTITGFTRAEVVGRKVPVSPSGLHDQRFYETMWEDISRTGEWQGEIWNRRKSGEVELDLVRIGAVRDGDGLISNYFAIYTDIHELKSFQKRLERMAHYDALTDLPNVTYFTRQLETAIHRARRLGSALAVVYIDIDNFGEINATHGEHHGDHLILAVAQRLSRRAPGGALLARVGGDEFALLLSDLRDWQAAETQVNRLIELFAEAFTVDGLDCPIRVAASFGVTIFPDDDADAGELLRHAQVSMYRAKDEARGRCRYFDANQNQAARQRRTLLSRIEKALRQNQFVLYYQPKVAIASGRLEGFEALLRWIDPELGLIPPGDFLPEAEQHEIIVDIGEWVMREALRQALAWQAGGLRTQISVNIAALHLQQPDFLHRLHTAVADLPGASPQHLDIEILESGAMANLHHVNSLVASAQQAGFGFSLDDFGTGYSSLAYLRELPVATVKIDQTFVRNLFEREGDAAIVQAVVGIADALGRRVVAEGVETLEHGMLLASLGCGVAQGYGIGRPMPAGEVMAWRQRFRVFPEWQEWAGRPWQPVLLRHLTLRRQHHDWLQALGRQRDPDGISDSPLLAQAPAVCANQMQQLHEQTRHLCRCLGDADPGQVAAAIEKLRDCSQALIRSFDATLD
ncbi:EAL domain-containing protein [Dechloromonas sp. ZY10]|uniref:putative bifunctional diguanylate cyclase/phosphodiesterase n=1 Tax=Dechloromonas aquae TaxID=2664436 RepID=UPI00352833F8